MFLLLFRHLLKYQSPLNAFTYLSSRNILALVTSIFLSMILYPPIIRLLRAFKLGQPIRELGPTSHQSKKGTPTMGGGVIVFTTLLSAMLWMDISNRHFYSLVLAALGFGAVGFADDYLKLRKKNSDGLSFRFKMAGLLLVSALTLGWHLLSTPGFLGPQGGAVFQSLSTVPVPFFKDFSLSLGWFYLLFAVIVLVGTSNAVNITDGLDGLVIGPVITCCAALLILSYVTGNVILAKYLYYHTVPGSGEVTVFLSGLIGSSIGFLWYNTWPAQVFMGDSGSLSIGGILAMVALITHHELLLIILGGVFVCEALSVMIQVGYFKLTGRRVFLMAPVHHHFEKLGWPEQKITIRAWIISFILALLSILTLKLR